MKTSFAAALAALALIATTPAHAMPKPIKGIPNGTNWNGLTYQGTQLQGIRPNGTASQGVLAPTATSGAITVTAVTLADGTVIVLE